ncbi:MAG: RNA polymerase sigma factor FliA [Pseudomonadota bacterium]|nr:RNA polymerase sigma factor FliA [Pseudomonadota bacterium]
MYKANGKVDQEAILKEHAPLVRRIAHHMIAKLPPSVDIEDLVQAGMIGLLDAINRYEEEQGAQFSTYAAQRIRGAMLDELRENDWLPRGQRKNMRKVEEAINVLQQRLARPPKETELATHMGISLQDFQQLLQDARGYQLIHFEDFNDDDDDHFLDRNCPDTGNDPLGALLDDDLRSNLIRAIGNLPEREKVLMGLYYEQELNLREIGAVLGVSESRVCQLHSQAVARLRATLRERAWTSVEN